MSKRKDVGYRSFSLEQNNKTGNSVDDAYSSFFVGIFVCSWGVIWKQSGLHTGMCTPALLSWRLNFPSMGIEATAELFLWGMIL